MCVGIPMQVIAGDDTTAHCTGNGRDERLNLMLIGAQPPGTWVLAHQGAAIRVLTEDEARATSDALGALQAAMTGDGDVDRFFADLADHVPQLPAHLQKGAS